MTRLKTARQKDMGPLFVALLLLSSPSAKLDRISQGPQERDVDALTLERVRNAIVPVLDFRETDVREALRWLFRQGLVGGTIAPDVQGTITMSLRDLPWETALQNVARQVDATYRIDHGFFEIVRKQSDPPSALPSDGPDVLALRTGYERIAGAVGQGSRALLARSLKPGFASLRGEARLPGEEAVRDLIATTRDYPRLAFDRVVGPWGKGAGGWVVRVAYTRGAGESVAFRDCWESTSAGWLLASRRPDSPESRRFEGVLLSEALRATFQDVRASWTLDSSLDRKVTIDLSGLPFEMALQKVTRLIGATYRIEGGVYQIVPRS